MASVLQAVKQQQLTDLEERESRVAFEIVTNASAVDGEMNARQLKTCLRALGFPATTSADANAFVYEFDYKSTHTIGLPDFQRIYLFKARQRSLQTLFDEAFEALDGERDGSIRLQALHRNAMTSFSAAALNTEDTPKRRHVRSRINDSAFVRCAALQYYDEGGSEHAIDSFLHSVPRITQDSEHAAVDAETRISREALGAFLRI